MTDRREPRCDPLRRAAAAPVLVDATEFARVLDGWAELDAIGELSGALIVVRTGSETSAAALAALAEVADVAGPLDAESAGALISADRDAVDAVSAEVHATLSSPTGPPVWVAAVMVAGTGSADLLQRGRRVLQAAGAFAGGCVVRVDGTIDAA